MVENLQNLGNMHSDIHDIVFDINDSNRMYCATDGGVEVGMVQNTMEMVSNIPVLNFITVSTIKNHVYGGLQDNGSWYGPSKVRAE
jgi:hypothetical protein